MASEELLQKVKTAPKAPGCYLFRDRQGNIIYVGKAKRLSTRVRNYFQPSAAQDERLEDLLPQITDVEYRETASELDALMLEYRLIKQHKPWFNSQLKPDKRRPWLRIDMAADFPTLTVVSVRTDDAAEYFDCFIDEQDVKAALLLFNQVWRTPQCGRASFGKAGSPCLYHSLNVCFAPCSGRLGEADSDEAAAYREAVEQVLRLLHGKSVPKLAELKTEMRRAADALEFEKAATCKAQLDGLRRIQVKAKRMFHLPEDADVLVRIRPYREKAFSLFYAHNGEVWYRADFLCEPDMGKAADMADEKALVEFLAKIKTGRPSIEDNAWLAGCLTEVLADKEFAVLGKGKSAKTVARRWLYTENK